MARIVIFFISSIILSSCFVADEIFLEKESTSASDNLQLKSENAVRAYIQADLTKESNYLAYGFSDIKIIKPLAIAELEDLENQLKSSPHDTILKTQYLEKKAYVRKMELERVIELDHFFTIEKDSNSIQILELTYFLNDTFGVRSFEPEILLSIPKDYKTVLDYYFNEYTIFMARSYSEGRKLSLNFYHFFKERLEQLETVQAKSKFLRHVLDICRIVKITGEFNQNFVLQTLLKNFILTEREDITNYEALEFSDLYETRNNDNNELLGYYFFHKFIGTYNTKLDTNVVLVEFSTYYEVDQIFQMDQPFENYIKPKQ